MSAITDLRGSAADGKLVIVTGAGVSLALASSSTPAMNWTDLVRDAFAFAERKGKIDPPQTARWSDTLSSGDMDELLGAAEFVIRKLGGRAGILYSRWLQERFESQKGNTSPMRNAVKAIAKTAFHFAPLITIRCLRRLQRLRRYTSESNGGSWTGQDVKIREFYIYMAYGMFPRQ